MGHFIVVDVLHERITMLVLASKAAIPVIVAKRSSSRLPAY
jgi:hypothetical protein